MGIAQRPGGGQIPLSAERIVDPKIAASDPNERPEVTLDRTRRLLMRSRETLAVASRQLRRSHPEDTADRSAESS